MFPKRYNRPLGGLKSAILESAPALCPPRFEVKICDVWDSTQPAMTPPSTGMIFPVMADPASEQRKPTTDVSVRILIALLFGRKEVENSFSNRHPLYIFKSDLS